MELTPALARLMQELEKLPGVGPKTAQRLAFYILSRPKEEILSLARAIIDVKERITTCRRCFNFSEEELCTICKDMSREQSTLCVVADPLDLMAVESSGAYKGLYHVLHGVISPLDGIGPEDLRIRELIERLKCEPIREVILALNPTVEGDATAHYIAELLKPFNLKLTQLAMGIPAGGDLNYADRMTIARALIGRREFSETAE
ncbi:MAG: recombination mediator RecR [Armatimonadota bacterium]|nr:recombination mediator RecR [Armatimonadota bacterium]MCX7777996.1 recombination mediator RecR [Armatimonadota bacterium]MDW8026029.1 recombination mediator RecR [Armatimonadota bacterium]